MPVIQEALPHPEWGPPWEVEFSRLSGDFTTITVRGSRGGLKARLNVRTKDLKQAVGELKEVP